MILMTLQEIAEAVQGKLVGTDATVSGVCIDTRILAEGDLYIAIKGEQFDGHDFIAQAEKKGALALLVAKQVTSDKPQIIVKDTRLALAQLAGAVRAKVQVKVCGITGSNGKTTVKEMVAAVLAVNYRVLFTQGNFNNAIGVPLTLLRLQAEDEFAVIEMGANHAGEIAYTSAYAQPDVVVITNVGAAHIEGFGSIEGIALAKAEIIESLTDQGIAVLNADDTFFTQWLALAGQRKVLSFGLNANADVTAENIVTGFAGEQFCTQFDLLSEGKRVPIRLALAGEHNVKNALAASSACLALGIEVKQIQEGLKQVKAVKGRLQLSVTGLGYRVINDTYNANPDSLTVALAVLKNCEGELWLALGAFGELGAGAEQLHSEMGQKIKQAGVMRLFVTGALAKSTVKAFGVGAEFFTQQEDLITAVQQAINPKVVLLVKGSRVQRMENVVNALVNKVEK
ncbi:UDP-N-acetylmuramoyl-tripeptide--D-alanyl-D-alanine ligase [methanotrophic endosymbiont of Bathymodiolus puteoserpentis (Logatchev)]|jgi:UDP-N-acetylmuramoyl-tripeptide--D-alanyl-D-alanine ligase|uniref:UDP-N-acetylmuramoyl-tripeptide--D-alanyl-D- alanine ligase n=1 Tax=methanotrophic endosymbiont of Bathymodiolus puteoserpentis (Logatchev) TaxID=343235 RepID=UPI0013C86F19|nr:UDP-N-acetylmuramoylalanyl-D-glutamyl-2,6-diaminopimelate--D-alanyl-D-alanine ligase [methanotrophic endosymbiont of Bathymodiolus puteoserpentis (Logatchev)]